MKNPSMVILLALNPSSENGNFHSTLCILHLTDSQFRILNSSKTTLKNKTTMANKYSGTQTEKNLAAAFAGESQARNK